MSRLDIESLLPAEGLAIKDLVEVCQSRPKLPLVHPLSPLTSSPFHTLTHISSQLLQKPTPSHIRRFERLDTHAECGVLRLGNEMQKRWGPGEDADQDIYILFPPSFQHTYAAKSYEAPHTIYLTYTDTHRVVLVPTTTVVWKSSALRVNHALRAKKNPTLRFILL